MLGFVTSQCFLIQNFVGLFNFPFPSSPGFVYNQRHSIFQRGAEMTTFVLKFLKVEVLSLL